MPFCLGLNVLRIKQQQTFYVTTAQFIIYTIVKACVVGMNNRLPQIWNVTKHVVKVND